MNIFSFLWMLLIVILTISNIYLIFKYFLDRYLAKDNQKIDMPLMPVSVLVIMFFCNIITNLSKNDNSYELIEILSLNRIEPLIVIPFLASSLLLIILAVVNYDLNFMLKYLNIIIVFILIFTSFPEITKGLGAILFGETTPPLSVVPFERKIFFVYRVIVFPSIYLVSYLLFWFISKRKIYNKNDYSKKIKAVDKLKNFVLFFYLIFIVGMIYLKLKHIDFFPHRSSVFLIEIINKSFIFIIIYIGISYYISNKDNKAELFGNLFKKTYVLGILFPIVTALVFLGHYKLQELEINIIITIITVILTAVITCIFNVYINRYFNSKY